MDRTRKVICLTLASLVVAIALIGELALSQDLAYVGQVSGPTDITRISVIDTTSNTLESSIEVGFDYVDFVVSPDGQKLYVTDGALNGTVAVFDAFTGKRLETIDVGESPRSITITPDGSKVYVANSNGGSVSVIDSSSNSVVKTVEVGNTAEDLALTSGGALVVPGNRGRVVFIDITTDTVIDSIRFDLDDLGTPIGVSALGDSSTILVITRSPDNTVVVDATSKSIITSLPRSKIGAFLTLPGRSKVLASEPRNDQILILDGATFTREDSIPVDSPASFARVPSRSSVYVANFDVGTVSVLELNTNTVSETINTGGRPRQIWVTPSGSFAYVLKDFLSGTISVIHTEDNRVIKTLDVIALASKIQFAPRPSPPVNTPAGHDVQVNLGDIAMTFAEVISGGETSCSANSQAPFGSFLKLSTASPYIQCDTGASFDGPIRVTVPYEEAEIEVSESELKMFKASRQDGKVVRTDITISRDTNANTITGQTNGFSFFVVGAQTGDLSVEFPTLDQFGIIVLTAVFVTILPWAIHRCRRMTIAQNSQS